ncbi:MAG: hypothetical protein ACRC6T_01100 [Sarcina sp.]
MKKGVIAVIIAVVILAGAAYGHHKEVLTQEKTTVQNEVGLMQQEIKGGNAMGANTQLVKIMESNYPLTKIQEESYRSQIDNISKNNATVNSKDTTTNKSSKVSDNTNVSSAKADSKKETNIVENKSAQTKDAQTSELSVKKIIADYLNVTSINNMAGIGEASVNGIPFYVATEGAAPNGKLENLDKTIKPISIFKGIEGYEFSMKLVDSKVNCYFFVSKDGIVYTWDNILEGFKNGTLEANISSGLDRSNPNDLNKFVGEFGPTSGTSTYYRWSGKTA